MSAHEMSSELAEVFELIQKDVVWLHAKWINYCRLYETNKERIDLLNNVAPYFFHIVQNVFLTDIFMNICRFTDPAKTGKKENLTLDRLFQTIDKNKYPDLVISVEEKLEVVKEKCKPFRKYRNRLLAHKDLPTALKVNRDPIPGINRKMIEDALLSIRELLNTIQLYFNNGVMGYEHTLTTRDGENLIMALENAEKYRTKQRKKYSKYLSD
jgi:hypothetical protein